MKQISPTPAKPDRAPAPSDARASVAKRSTAVDVRVPGRPVRAPGTAGANAAAFVAHVGCERGTVGPFDTYRTPYAW